MKTDDLRISRIRPLLAPAILSEEIPMTPRASDCIASARRTVEAILDNRDPRLLVIVGPCSIHDTKERQLDVVNGVLAQRLAGQVALKALMIESHLVGGRQEPSAGTLIYRQSITDACLPLTDTKRAIETLATLLG